MKKQVVSVMVGAAMAASMIAGCGSSSTATSSSAAESASASSAAATASSSANETAEASSETAEASSESGSASGSVYMLNFKPETDEAWQDLASTYMEQNPNVDVTVVTAADGQYATTLQSEMAKSEAPTIFNIGSSTDAQTWDAYTYDLKDTDLYKHVTDHSLDVNYNGKVAGIANCYEAYGIIVNKTLLDNYYNNN